MHCSCTDGLEPDREGHTRLDMLLQVSAVQALKKILLLSPSLSVDHEDLLIGCLSGWPLVQLAAVASLGSLAKAYPVHHAHTFEMLGQLALDTGGMCPACPAP